MGFFFSKIVRNLVLAYVIFSGIQYGLRFKSYNISPKEFKTIASKSQDKSAATAINRFSSEFRRAYGRLVATETYWNVLSLGGLETRALFLHASLTEYVAVIGAPLPTTGRAGLHWSNSTCTVLSGNVRRAADDAAATKEAFTTGSNFRHGQFERYIYSFSEDAYIACYGRGLVPVSGVWAATGALARGEPLAFGQLVYTYGQLMLSHFYMAAENTFNHYKGKVTGKSEL